MQKLPKKLLSATLSLLIVFSMATFMLHTLAENSQTDSTSNISSAESASSELSSSSEDSSNPSSSSLPDDSSSNVSSVEPNNSSNISNENNSSSDNLPAGAVEINDTNFLDNNFRDYLLSRTDTYTKDGDVCYYTEAQITAITEIKCSDKNIGSLQGIEHFTNLQTLDCSLNRSLSSLDISHNIALTNLNCSQSNLTALVVSNNTALETLDCGDNAIESLDLSHNTDLKYLDCYFNHLTSLDVSNNTALEFLDCSCNVNDDSTPRLKTLTLRDQNTSANNLKTLYCNTNILTELDVSRNTALQTLHCYDNQLTDLDVSNNTALEELDCNSNFLKSLDISNNTALQTLYCYNNQLSKLDVNNNTDLQRLGCHSNQLTSIDVSNNTKLNYLDCNDNQLTVLEVSKNTALTNLYCGYNQLKNLDLSNNTFLETLWCNNNQLTSLDTSKLNDLSTFLGQEQSSSANCYYDTTDNNYKVKMSEVIGENGDITKVKITSSGWSYDVETGIASLPSNGNAPSSLDYNYATDSNDHNLNITLSLSMQTYLVKFNSNGGSDIKTQTIIEGQLATKPDDPAKESFTFAGWFTDENLTQAFDFNTPITANITLYAKWDENKVDPSNSNSQVNSTTNGDPNNNSTVNSKTTGQSLMILWIFTSISILALLAIVTIAIYSNKRKN